MGQGKTMAAINYMNTAVDKKFIFLTPYLNEVDRVISECSSRGFVSPQKEYKTNFSKLNDIHRMISSGKNIASTHALFDYWNRETFELLNDNHYNLILDEVVDVISEDEDLRGDDIKVLIDSGCLSVPDKEICTMEWVNDDYKDGKFVNIMKKAQTKSIVTYEDKALFWIMPPEAFQSFDDVMVLTYLFDAQPLKYFLDLYGFDFEYVGVKSIGEQYGFCPVDEMVVDISERKKIHVLDHKKLNSIGDSPYALSLSWFTRNITKNSSVRTQLKNNIYNYFTNILDSVPAENRMWTTFKKSKEYVKGRGYTKSFVSCNVRATNGYRNKTALAYCLNVYFNPWVKRFFDVNGVDVKQNKYALSEMAQWIYRSAIRDGNDVWIYVPSKRMRGLLLDWIDGKEV